MMPTMRPGSLIASIRTHADNSLAFTSITTPDGTNATDQYDNAGGLTKHSVLRPDGSTDITDYVNGAPSKEV